MTSRDVLHVLERLFRRYSLHNKRPFDGELRAEAYVLGIWIELSTCDDGSIWAAQFDDSGEHYADTSYAAVQAAKDAYVDSVRRGIPTSPTPLWAKDRWWTAKCITLDNQTGL